MITAKQDYDVLLTGQALAIERDLEPVIDQMNKNSLKVDRAKLTELHLKWVAKISLEGNTLEKETGLKGFRANSSADCANYFLNKGWTPTKMTAKGRPSMDQEVLQELAKSLPIANKIIEARESIAVFGQLHALAAVLDAENTDEVQPKWNQLGTPMGRLSCEGFAVQNRVKEVQECFVPHDGYTYLSVDISQAEYVGWASLSQDELLSNIFMQGQDLHERMGELIATKVPALKAKLFREDLRNLGKTVNFALLYLARPSTLAKMLGCTEEIAEDIVSVYSSLAEDAIVYRNKFLRKAQETGAVATKFGRVRELSGLLSSNDSVRRPALKTAWHHHNAGSVADLIKLKWVAIDDALQYAFPLEKNECVKWVMNRHDELVMEVKDGPGIVDAVKGVVEKVMAAPVDGFLPLKSEIRVGSTWASVSS